MIRILAISDEITQTLHQANLTDMLGPIDVLLACGDLPYSYMEFIATQCNTRHAYYVHGNHDTPENLHGGRVLREPGGWENVDRRTVTVDGGALIVAGLEGCIRYKRGPYQYTDREMWLRARRLVINMLLNRVRYGRYLDVLIAHSPARGIHDDEQGAHRGFAVLRSIVERFRPRLFLHGHNHHYGPSQWQTQHADTLVINVHPFRLVEMDDDDVCFHPLCRH